LNDYGIRPGTVFGLDSEKGYYPKDTDVYNPNLPNNGNSNYGDSNFYAKMDWSKTSLGNIDIRLFYTGRGASSWSKCRWTDGEST